MFPPLRILLCKGAGPRSPVYCNFVTNKVDRLDKCGSIPKRGERASGEDESNPALWLATRAGKMELSCPLGTTRRVPPEKFLRKQYNKSFIDQACSAKMAGYWPRSIFASLWTSTPSRPINSQKKNLANIQPSWPHAWSITHMSRMRLVFAHTTVQTVILHVRTESNYNSRHYGRCIQAFLYHQVRDKRRSYIQSRPTN